MKYIFLISVAVLMFLSDGYAQSATNKDIEAIYKRQADFSLKYATSDGAIPVKLKASYDRKEKLYKVILVKTDKEEDLLQIFDPLSYEYFNAAFFDSLKKKIPEIKPISNIATQSVFTWLYTLSAGNEDEIVNSGTLWLKNCAMIFGPGKENEKYKKVIPREHFLDSISNKLQSHQRALSVLKKEVQLIFERRIKREIKDTVENALRYTYALSAKTIISLSLDLERTKKISSANNINVLKKLQGIDTNTHNYDSLQKINEAAQKKVGKTVKELEQDKNVVTAKNDSLRSKENENQKELASLRRKIDAIDTIISDMKLPPKHGPDSIALISKIDLLKKQNGIDTTGTTFDSLLAKAQRRTDSIKVDLTKIKDSISVSDTLKSKAELKLKEMVQLVDKIDAIKTIIADDASLKAANRAIDTLNPKLAQAEISLALKKATKDSSADQFKLNTEAYEKYNALLSDVTTDAYADQGTFWSDLENRHIGSLLPTDTVVINRYFDQKKQLKNIQDVIAAGNVRPINSVSLQFERGYLERIQVWVSNGYGSDIYENIYAIGMSSINNLKAFNTMNLFIRKSSGEAENLYYIKLSDVLGNYDNFLALFTRDYSPADTEINNVNPASNPCLILRKERLINLFDTKVYTDFAGLKEGNPNGLVQLDACRRFNVNNSRRQVKNGRSDYGFFDNITVFGAITKIEQKEKRLLLRNNDFILNNKIISPSYATTLDLRQYENASLGTDLNVALFDYPDGKFTMYFNLGLRYAHTPLEDSVRTVKNNRVDTPGLAINLDAHSFTWQPKLSIEFFAERRVGLVLSYQYNIARYYTNNNFKPVMSYAKSDPNALPLEGHAGYYHMYELFLRIETSRANNGRMFLRARYFMQRGDLNTFFPQVQLGYAYNLVFRK